LFLHFLSLHIFLSNILSYMPSSCKVLVLLLFPLIWNLLLLLKLILIKWKLNTIILLLLCRWRILKIILLLSWYRLPIGLLRVYILLDWCY